MTKLSLLKRGEYARRGNVFFLGLGNGEAFIVMANQKCERIGPVKEFCKNDLILSGAEKKDFQAALRDVNHSGDWFSKLCENAIKHFHIQCYY